MAILSKKSEEKVETEVAISKPTATGTHSTFGILVNPRISEKAVLVAKNNQYIFKVAIKANKLQIKKALESFYGIKISKVRTILVEGKARTYGRTSGKNSDFKKAIVTLTSNSKKPSFVSE